MWVLEEELLGAPAVSFPDSIPNGFCSQKLWGLKFLALESWLGSWCGAGTPHFQDIIPEFLSTTQECGTSLFHACSHPTSLGGCGFFNSVVVRLPFNSISNSAV